MAGIGSATLPEPLSIRDILRRNSLERLIVHPMQWTEQQLQHLECQFRRLMFPQPPEPVNSSGHYAQSDDTTGGEPQQQPRRGSPPEIIHKAVRCLRVPTIPQFRASTIEYLLADYGLLRVW